MADVLQKSRRTRIVCISDTHNQTPKLPQGDVLVHAGDLTNQGSFSELQKTVQWLESTSFESKIVVAGNHDVTLDKPWFDQHQKHFRYSEPQVSEACLRLLTNSSTITYLSHESTTVHLTRPGGPGTSFKVFGSPYSPTQGLWAFGYEPQEAAKLWSCVPLDTDIVVTHTPPSKHCDKASPGSLGGCEALLEAIRRIRPKLAICGHKHPGRGVKRIRWSLDALYSTADCTEADVEAWIDPGAGQGNRKESRIDLSSKSGKPLQNTDTLSAGQMTNVDPMLSQSSAQLQRKWTPPCLDDHEEAVDEVELSHHRMTEDLWRLDNDQVSALHTRTGRKETCIVNASYLGSAHGTHKQFNKPIVVDLDLPVYRGRDIK